MGISHSRDIKQCGTSTWTVRRTEQNRKSRNSSKTYGMQVSKLLSPCKNSHPLYLSLWCWSWALKPHSPLPARLLLNSVQKGPRERMEGTRRNKILTLPVLLPVLVCITSIIALYLSSNNWFQFPPFWILSLCVPQKYHQRDSTSSSESLSFSDTKLLHWASRSGNPNHFPLFPILDKIK